MKQKKLTLNEELSQMKRMMKKLMNENIEDESSIDISQTEDQQKVVDTIEKIEDKMVPELENSVENLSDEQKTELMKNLNSLGITADSDPQEVLNKIQSNFNHNTTELDENETQKKAADILSDIGSGLMGSLLVPLIPVAVGSGLGIGFAGGLAATIGVSGLLLGLAKILGKKENSTEHGNY